MKEILIFGAYDRYNYGDNLMPIVFHEYIKNYHSGLLDNYKLSFVAISESNLTNYGCYKTEDISEKISTLSVGSSIIVIGGEVLCGKNSELFLHMQSRYITHLFWKGLKKITRRWFSKIVNPLYATPWEYPFIPDKNMLPEGVKVIFNSVGGTLANLNDLSKKEVVERLQRSDLVSVRDGRTFDQVRFVDNAILSPDSVLLISKVISDEYINSHVSQNIRKSCDKEYIVIQAAPKKVGDDLGGILKSIKKIMDSTRKKIILLPIGYASGHDDAILLERIHKKLNYETELLNNLNVWEILYVIKNSQMYIGTSLHGVITAISYGVPHFGLNKKITKLDEFLKSWSVPPFNQCYDFESIAKLVDADFDKSLDLLNGIRENAFELIVKNNERIIDVIKNNNEH